MNTYKYDYIILVFVQAGYIRAPFGTYFIEPALDHEPNSLGQHLHIVHRPEQSFLQNIEKSKKFNSKPKEIQETQEENFPIPGKDKKNNIDYLNTEPSVVLDKPLPENVVYMPEGGGRLASSNYMVVLF